SLNAPQDGGILPVEVQMDDALSVVDRLRRPFLEKTRPFVLVDGQRRSLAEAVQVRAAKALVLLVSLAVWDEVSTGLFWC
ncbi:hypothetical protein XENOCAPTIV_018393, partial [Xenoophorus captivus]